MRPLCVIFAIFLITGCRAENTYHGVAEPIWKQLSPEQKQLLVDRDFEKEFNDEANE